MALDESKDTDHVYDIDGFKYIVDKEFMKKTESIKIDFSGMGFKLDSGIDFGSAGSECSSCGTKTSSCC
jgi:Fe-S cluster assembly iron-binding protein IscA